MGAALVNITADDLGNEGITRLVAPGDSISLTFWERVSTDRQTVPIEYSLRRGSRAVKQIDQRWSRADRRPQVCGQKHTYVMQLLGPSDVELVFQRKKLSGDWTYGQLRLKIEQVDDAQLSVIAFKPADNPIAQVLERWRPGTISAFHPEAGPYPLDPVAPTDRHLSDETISEIITSSAAGQYKLVEEHDHYKVHSLVSSDVAVELLAYDTITGQRLGMLARDSGAQGVPALPELKQLADIDAENPLSAFLRERAAVVEEWPSRSPIGSIPQIFEAGHRFEQRRQKLIHDDAKDEGLEKLMQAGRDIPAHELGGVNHDLREQSLTDENERFQRALAESDVAGMDADEVLDLVDADDQVIGSLDRRSIYQQDLHNFRIIYGLIVNAEEQLWTPRRSATKTICPEHLDAGIGGHVKSGETYEAALAREGLEELNLDIIREDVVFLGSLTPDADGSYAYTKVYQINSEIEPVFNPVDISGGEWLYPEEIVALAKTGEKVKSDLLVIAEALSSGRLPEKNV